MSTTSRQSLSLYQAFLERPERDSYLAVGKALKAKLGARIDETELDILAEQVKSRNWRAACFSGERLGAAWMLSPKYHFLLARIARARRDVADEELEVFQFRTCLSGLMATGDGTADRPYIPFYPTDAADVLASFDQRAISRLLIRRARKLMEVVTCEGGREIWFDASKILGRPESLPERAAARGLVAPGRAIH